MPRKTASAHNTEHLAEEFRHANDKFTESVMGEGAAQMVMEGFAGAYREWLEAMSSKPEALVDLQSRYMQEQVNLWMNAMQRDGPAKDETSDKRFSGPEWNELPVFGYL